MAGKIEMARGVAGGRLAWVAEGGLEGGYMVRVTPRAPTRPRKTPERPYKPPKSPIWTPKSPPKGVKAP